jgi:hypothetical protein
MNSCLVKSFGRRQAYESRRGTNPRAARVVYGDFGLWPLLRVAGRLAGCARRDADEAHCRSIERFARCGERLGYALLASLMSFGARDHCSKRMRCEA